LTRHPSGRRRPVTDEARAICALANYVGFLTGRFSKLGPDGSVTHKKPRSLETVLWAVRKQALTAECSSRLAGWVTKSSNDAYELAMRNRASAKFSPDALT